MPRSSLDGKVIKVARQATPSTMVPAVQMLPQHALGTGPLIPNQFLLNKIFRIFLVKVNVGALVP